MIKPLPSTQNSETYPNPHQTHPSPLTHPSPILHSKPLRHETTKKKRYETRPALGRRRCGGELHCSPTTPQPSQTPPPTTHLPPTQPPPHDPSQPTGEQQQPSLRPRPRSVWARHDSAAKPVVVCFIRRPGLGTRHDDRPMFYCSGRRQHRHHVTERCRPACLPLPRTVNFGIRLWLCFN